MPNPTAGPAGELDPALVSRARSAGTFSCQVMDTLALAVNLMSGIIGSAFVFFVFLITKRSLAHFFSIMIALVISTTAVSYVFIFPALVALRIKHPDDRRPYRVLGGIAGAWAAAIITEAFVVVTAVTLLWPGAINAWFGQSYSVKTSWGVSRAFIESVTLGALGVMILAGVVFWAIGERSRHRGLVGTVVPGEEGPPARQ